jgi:hypothetical protein
VKISGTAGRLLKELIRLLSVPILVIKARPDGVVIDYFPEPEPTIDVDERIANLDRAKGNLLSALSAIDELKVAAGRNKVELADALRRIDEARSQKAAAEKELDDVRRIAQTDVSVFRRLARIPDRAQIALDRLFAFFLGVASSLIASALWRLIFR